MEILDGLYRSKTPILFEDAYGGTPVYSYIYSYLLFRNGDCYKFNSYKPFEVVGKTKYNSMKMDSFNDYETLRRISKIILSSEKIKLKKEENAFTFELMIQIADHKGDIIDIRRFHKILFSDNRETLELIYWNEGQSTLINQMEFELIIESAV